MIILRHFSRTMSVYPYRRPFKGRSCEPTAASNTLPFSRDTLKKCLREKGNGASPHADNLRSET